MKKSAVIHAQLWHGHGFTDKEKITGVITDATRVFGLSPDKIILIGSTADVDLSCEKWNYYFSQSEWAKNCRDLTQSRAVNIDFIKITQALRLPENVYFVYTYEKLCDLTSCKSIENNTLYYSDSHHLTKEGTMMIMPKIQKIIDK